MLKFLEITYEGQPIMFPLQGIGDKVPLRIVRDMFIRNIVIDRRQTPNHWWVRIGDEPNWIGDAELGRYMANVSRVEFVYREDGLPPPPSVIKPQIFSATERLNKLFRDAINRQHLVYGLTYDAIRNMLNHISERTKLLTTTKTVLVQTENVKFQTFFYLARMNQSICVAPDVKSGPSGGAGHAACICFYRDTKEVLFLDSWGSVYPTNLEMWEWITTSDISSKWKLSYTFFNYQIFDNPDVNVKLGGGLCSVFTLVQTIRCISEHSRYEGKQYTFSDWIDRAIQVLQMCETEESSAIALNQIFDAWRRLIYILQGNGQSERDCCAHVESFTLPSAHFDSLRDFVAFLKNFTQQEYSEQLRRISFTADIMFLDMFIDLKLGFDRVYLMGKAMRDFLDEIPRSGFVK